MNWLVLDKTDWAVADVETEEEALEIAESLKDDPIWRDGSPYRVVPS